MLLRNSISNTRRFFQRTLGSLKSLFSGGSYQRLPKSPLKNPNFHTTTTCALDMNIKQSKGSEKLYADFTRQWGSGDVDPKASERTNKLKIISKPSKGEHKDHKDNKPSVLNSSAAKKIKKSEIVERRDQQAYRSNKVVIVKGKVDDSHDEEGVARNYALVEKKLKELEMLDVSNVDHVLDIEEVLHYYSRLTCPAYLEIVDSFFTEIFAEFFGSSTPIRSINSRLMRPRSEMIRS